MLPEVGINSSYFGLFSTLRAVWVKKKKVFIAP